MSCKNGALAHGRRLALFAAMQARAWCVLSILGAACSASVEAPCGACQEAEEQQLPSADASEVSGDAGKAPGDSEEVPGDSSGGVPGDPAGPGSDPDTPGDPEAPVALFAINDLNDYDDPNITSFTSGCTGPSFNSFVAAVEDEFPNEEPKLVVSGWSCGATYALIRGFEHADVVRGILHINQASTGYATYLEQAFERGGSTRIPVFLVHDFGFDAGGALTVQWLEEHGYQEGVDLRVMNRPGTGHDPNLTNEEKEEIANWMRSL